MQIVLNDKSIEYDVENICEIFFPLEKIKVMYEEPEIKDNISLIIVTDEKSVTIKAFVYDIFEKVSFEFNGSDKNNIVAKGVYNVFSKILDIDYPWGILYGVRPARYMHSLEDKYGMDIANEIFRSEYMVCNEKLELVKNVCSNDKEIIGLSRDNSFSIYVSIPFCPSRCSYCSFVSHSIENTNKLINEYVELLIDEIVDLSIYVKKLHLNLETIYFGGGTPTTLSSNQLERIINAIINNFDVSCVKEFTVEAGRPDTIDREKLLVLKNNGVDRISINPQTFNDNVLSHIGRKHSSKDTIDAFKLARNIGFDNINMDFIAGLPNESFDSFIESIKTGIELGPESITIHTLSLKTGSYLVTKDETFSKSEDRLVANMIRKSNEYLYENNYLPYYMYRQGKSLGNLENVGWSKSNKKCLYNIFMMDETHSIFSVGAGAVTKLKNPKTGKIERIYNYKYPYEYIDHFDNILNRKKKIIEFYKNIEL